MTIKSIVRLTMQRSRIISWIVVMAWRIFRKNGYESISRQADSYLSDMDDKKRAKRMHSEMMRDYVAYGALPEDYMFFDFEKLSRVGKSEYITDKMRFWLLYQINSKNDFLTFFNKYKSYQTFKNFYKREAILIKSEDDYNLFLSFLTKHRELVVKRVEFSRGRDVQLIKYEDSVPEDIFRQLMDDIDDKGYIVEEKIKQHQDMLCLNPSSVNTVRIPTLLTENGVEIFNPVIRIGRAGSFVDNAAQGGILAAVDKVSGIVYTKGRTENNQSFVIHPDSGIVIPGFKVPEWDSLVEIVKEAALVVRTTKYVGWDMAYSDRGWVIVEGNNFGQPSILEIPRREGCRYEMENLMKIKAYN